LLGILAGLAVAIYLTTVHYQEGLLVCGVGGDCHTVQSSDYATVGPIPVALLGVGLMGTLLGLWLLRWWRPDLQEATTVASFVLLVAAVASEGYLTWVELFVIDAICQWCVIFAVVLVLLLIIEGIRLWRVVLAEPEIPD
jgi:uncharacterized membrane protein